MLRSHQTKKPRSFQVLYKVLQALSELRVEDAILVRSCLERLSEGQETLLRSIWDPTLYYVFMKSEVSTAMPVGESTGSSNSATPPRVLTLAVEMLDDGLSVRVTDLLC